MARVSKPTGKRVSGPSNPTSSTRAMPDRQRQIGQGMANPYARQNYNAQLAQDQANTRRIAGQAIGAVTQAITQPVAWMRGVENERQRVAGRYPSTGWSPTNSQMSPAGPAGAGYNRQLLMNNQLQPGNMTAYGPQQQGRQGSFGQQQFTVGPQTQQQPWQNQRANQASAGRYNAAYQQGRWAPDYAAARKYAGYGSPSQGLMDAPASDASWQAMADRYTAQANRYYNPPAPGGGGGGGGWVDWGGGGGGGGGYTERPPEWYERMAQWSYGKG